MTVEYLEPKTTDFAFDLALIDVVAKHFHDADVAANLRACIDEGKPLPRITELTRVLDVTLDEFLKRYLVEVTARTGTVYEVHGFLFRQRVN